MVQTARDATNDGAPAGDTDAIRELIDQALDEREAAEGFIRTNKITIVAWDGHLDRVWPTLILSTTAAASGMEVSVFFTFWGLFALVKPERRRKTGKDWMTKALGQMNPGSTAKAKLSRYNFAGMGPWMLVKVAEALLRTSNTIALDLLACRLTPTFSRKHSHKASAQREQTKVLVSCNER